MSLSEWSDNQPILRVHNKISSKVIKHYGILCTVILTSQETVVRTLCENVIVLYLLTFEMMSNVSHL